MLRSVQREKRNDHTCFWKRMLFRSFNIVQESTVSQLASRCTDKHSGKLKLSTTEHKTSICFKPISTHRRSDAVSKYVCNAVSESAVCNNSRRAGVCRVAELGPPTRGLRKLTTTETRPIIRSAEMITDARGALMMPRTFLASPLDARAAEGGSRSRSSLTHLKRACIHPSKRIFFAEKKT